MLLCYSVAKHRHVIDPSVLVCVQRQLEQAHKAVVARVLKQPITSLRIAAISQELQIDDDECLPQHLMYGVLLFTYFQQLRSLFFHLTKALLLSKRLSRTTLLLGKKRDVICLNKLILGD